MARNDLTHSLSAYATNKPRSGQAAPAPLSTPEEPSPAPRKTGTSAS